VDHRDEALGGVATRITNALQCLYGGDDRGYRRAQLVRRLGHEILPYVVEMVPLRVVDQHREHATLAGQTPRAGQDLANGRLRQVQLACLSFPGKRLIEHLSNRVVVDDFTSSFTN